MKTYTLDQMKAGKAATRLRSQIQRLKLTIRECQKLGVLDALIADFKNFSNLSYSKDKSWEHFLNIVSDFFKRERFSFADNFLKLTDKDFIVDPKGKPVAISHESFNKATKIQRVLISHLASNFLVIESSAVKFRKDINTILSTNSVIQQKLMLDKAVLFQDRMEALEEAKDPKNLIPMTLEELDDLLYK